MLSDRCPVCLSVCDVGVLWANGWTDQDETWCAGRPRPGHIVLDGDPAPPPPKGHSPHFRLIPVVAKWLHGSSCHLVWRYASAQETLFSAHVYCGPNGWMDQDGTWHGGRPQPRQLCVRWGPSHLPKKGAKLPFPIFGPFLLWPNGWMHQD